MRITTLFLREIRFRIGTFLLGVVGVAAAAGCLLGARAFLAAHDHRTEKLTGALEERAGKRMADLRDEARKFSKGLGFNAMLLPPEQKLSALYAEGRSTHFFSEKQVQALASAEFESLNHLRPILRERITWPEKDREIVLVGVRGEVYIKAPKWQKPIEEAIDPDAAHVGHALARDLDIAEGDTLTLRNRRFRVAHVLPEAGGKEDISVRINLKTAQKMLDQSGRISAVLALTCNCADADPALVRAEARDVIPHIQVVNFTTRAAARRKARDAIGKGTQAELADIKDSRAALRSQVARFARILVGAVTAGTVVLLSVLTLNNARDRRPEVAMLRALGLRRKGILSLFVAKALVTGAAGGVLGCLVGAALSRLVAGTGATVSIGFAAVTCLVAAAVAVIASLLPAVLAARQDPATILNQE